MLDGQAQEKRLLWVDDQIDSFQPWIQRFSENGVFVDPYESVDEAFEGMGSEPYDAILVDQLMPGRRGSDALIQFRAKAPDASLYVCSAYFYLDDVLDAVNERQKEAGITVGRIDKTSLPLTDDREAISEFLRAIFADPKAPERMAEAATKKLSGVSSHVPIYWEDYSRLDLSGKLEVNERVDSFTAEAREECFRKGSHYIVFCGSWSKPVWSSTDEHVFLPEPELLRLARDTGFAPFAYSSGGSIDDLTASCSSRNNMRGYPAIRMQSGDRMEAVHFDTGNPLSILSYEHYTMNGWIDPIHTIDTHFAGELTLRGKHQSIKEVIFTDSQEATKVGSLTAFAVLMWHEYRFAARCHNDCRSEPRLRESNSLCYFRRGLLGRSLGRDIECEFQVGFDAGSVLFRDRRR